MDGRRFPTEPWNGESENADAIHSAAGDLSGNGAFFWLLFFAPAKKSNSRESAKAFDFALLQASDAPDRRSTPFALSREFISFAGPKETNQRKGPSPTHHPRRCRARRHFRTRHSMARYENGGHPWPPPSGCPGIRGGIAAEKGVALVSHHARVVERKTFPV